LFERLDAKSQIVSTVGAARKDWQKGREHVKAARNKLADMWVVRQAKQIACESAD